MKVLLLAGGWSPEREVSLKGGEQIAAALKEKNVLFTALYGIDALAVDAVFDEVMAVAPRIIPHLTDVSSELEQAWNEGKSVLFEGAQGIHLDIDHGTYPFVTSSNTVSGNAAAGSGVATFSLPGTPGVPPAVVADTLLAPYNDLDAVKECFARHGADIAAVIVEPVAANMGLVLPKPGFLEGLRALADQYGSLLIFDEVITGFRAAFGGAQARFNIDPDLTTFGKIIGGGLPVGAFGGKRRFMEHVAPQGEVYQAGTLSGNPLAMAAGLATLRRLKTLDYDALEARTRAFAEALRDILRAKGVPVQMPTLASMFCPFFSEEPVTDFVQAQACDQKLFTSFYKQMRAQGIYLAPSGFETGMVSFAHSDEDFNRALDAARKVLF